MPYPTTAYAPNRRTSGFTLIELLVVIAIIAILAAILFPVFAKAREKARQAACLNNEKQIGLGLLQYVQDNDEMTPYFYFGPNGGGSGGAYYKWMDAVYPYIKSEAVFNCPDTTYPITNAAGNFYQYKYYQNLPSNAAAPGTAPTTGNFYYGSYGYNAMYRFDVASGRTPPCGSNTAPGLSIAAIGSPASTVWICDGSNYSAGWNTLGIQPNPIVNQNASPKAFNGNPNELIIGRHTDRACVIYYDGHVKAMTLDSLAKDVAADGKTLRQFTVQDD